MLENYPGSNIKKTPARKKEGGIFSKAANMAALGATLLGGELKAGDAKEVSFGDRKSAATENAKKTTDAESIRKIREELGAQGVEVESSLDVGQKWSQEDAKIFQGLREKAFFDSGMEERIGAVSNQEKELVKEGVVEENKFSGNIDEQRTGSSGWALNVVRHAEILQETVSDKNDAINLISKSYDAFVFRFQNPDPALGDSINETAKGGKFTELDRSGTKADFLAISGEADKLASIFEEVAKRQGIDEVNIKTKIDTLGKVSKKCREMAEQQSKL